MSETSGFKFNVGDRVRVITHPHLRRSVEWVGLGYCGKEQFLGRFVDGSLSVLDSGNHELVPPEPKPQMDWGQACQWCVENPGKWVKRGTHSDVRMAIIDCVMRWKVNGCYMSELVSTFDILATDWVVCDE